MHCYFVEITKNDEVTFHRFWQYTDETAEKLCVDNKCGASIQLYRFLSQEGTGEMVFLKEI